MDFNFYDEYKDLPTTDLLKIVSRPEGYQPEAVEAAARVLGERSVTEADVRAVEDHFHEIDKKKILQVAKVNAYMESASGLLEPIVKPGPNVNPEKWLRIFLIVYAANFAWNIYGEIKGYIRQTRYHTFHFDEIFLYNLFGIWFEALLFYLILKKKRIGWILLFANYIIVICIRFSSMFAYNTYVKAIRGNLLNGLVHIALSILIYLAFTFFLGKKEISDLFGVSARTKKTTAIVAICIGSLSIIAIPFMISH